jgi:hypothetical protein
VKRFAEVFLLRCASSDKYFCVNAVQKVIDDFALISSSESDEDDTESDESD